MSKFNVLVIAPDRLFREGLKRLFENSAFHVAAEIADVGRVAEGVPDDKAIDLILVEFPNDYEFGITLAQLRAALPAAKVVVLASRIVPGATRQMLRYVSALLSKDLSPSALFNTLDLVMLDENVLSIAQVFLAEPNPPIAATPNTLETTDLSVREIAILRHMANGLPNKAIALRLTLAETTIKAHVKMILKKIKAGNRTQAAVWCVTHGMNQAETGLDNTGLPGVGDLGAVAPRQHVNGAA